MNSIHAPAAPDVSIVVPVYNEIGNVDGLIERIEGELGETCTVIATGGLSGKIIPHCKRDIILDENLLLDGLRILYEKNQKKK